MLEIIAMEYLIGNYGVIFTLIENLKFNIDLK